jgi:CHRD domain/PEP-CTERM motif
MRQDGMKKLFGTVAAFALASAATPAVAATVYAANLLGANENPPVVSAATGSAQLTLNGNLLGVTVNFQNLSTPLADGHIHCCADATTNAGVAIGFGSLPLGAQSGTYTSTFDLMDPATYRSAYLNASGGTAALAMQRLVNAFDTRFSYVNIHSTQFPGGEIRGQVAAVPEPGTWIMMIGGFALTGAVLRRRRTALANA